MLHHEGTKDTKVTKDHKASALALSHEIVGAAIEVHRFTGPGLLESLYEGVLCRELTLRNIPFERQIGLPVRYKGEVLDCHVKLDLLVDKTVIVEVKAVDKLIPLHRAQLLTYLRLQNLWLGLLRVLRAFVVKFCRGSSSDLARLPC
jgi:GxxExxY protein